MKDRLTICVLTSLAAALVLSMSLTPIAGKAPVAGAQGRGQAAGRGAGPGAAIPRLADGKPDLSGVWQVLDNSIDGNVEPHAASFGVRAGQGVIVDPRDGK